MKKLFVLLCCFSFLTSWCLPSFADDAVELNKILIVTPKRVAQDARDAAANVSVITRQDIESSGAQNIPDLLRTVPGIRIFDNGSLKSATVDIRGFGDTSKQNVLVLVDGRRTNSIDISGADLVQIPIELVERVEIVRGANSVLYGDNAFGGVINIITRQSEKELDVQTTSTAGSYDTYGQDVLISGTNADTRYQAYYKYYEDGGWRQNSDGISRDANIKLGHDFTDKISVDVRAGNHNDLYHYPGSLRFIDLLTYGRNGTRFPQDYAHTEEWYVDSTIKWRTFDDDDYRGAVELTLNRRDRQAFSSYFTGSTVTDNDIQSDGVLLKYTSESYVYDRPLIGILGVDYYDHEDDILGRGLYNSEDLTISKTEIGFYSTFDYQFTDAFSADIGTRWHQAEYTFTQRNVITNASQRPDEWVSQAGVKYQYADNSFVHADVHQTFRFLAVDEWYSAGFAPPSFTAPGLNPGLKQQTGVEYEWGVKHDFGRGVDVGITNYLHDIKDEIYFNPSSFANENYDRTRRIGVEVAPAWHVKESLDLKKFDRFDLTAGYSWENAEFRGGSFNGNDVPFAPEHQGSLGVSLGFWKHFDWSLIGRYIGSSHAVNDQANTKPRIKPVTVADMSLSYRLSFESIDLEWFGRVENIFDRRYNSYEIEGSNRAFYPAPGREFLAGVKAKF